VLTENYYGYSPTKSPTRIDGMTPEELDGLIIGCSLKCITMLDSFNMYLDVRMTAYLDIHAQAFRNSPSVFL
jgi:hypothetical protein